MDILIYGAGAVGGYLGGMLALDGHRVTMIARPETAALIDERGFSITQGGRTNHVTVRACRELSEALQDAAYDLIILGMKSYDLAEAVAHLASLNPRPAQVMSLQNGIGVEEIIARHFDTGCILAGAVTIPISRRSANHVEIEREGRGLAISPMQSGRSIDTWIELFISAGIHAGFRPDYRAMKWSKAFLNIMGNASSAILNWSPIEIYRHQGMFDLEMRMLREMQRVMSRQGIEMINLPGATARPLSLALTIAPRPLLRFVYSQVIIHGRGEKMPSFHMDLSAGKGESEVLFHNGAIAATGRECGVATPVNSVLNEVLLAISSGLADWKTYQDRPERLLAEVESRTE